MFAGFRVGFVMILFIMSSIGDMDIKILKYDAMKKCVSNGTEQIIIVRIDEEFENKKYFNNSIIIQLKELKEALGEMNKKEFNEKFGRDKPSRQSSLVFVGNEGFTAYFAAVTAYIEKYMIVKYYEGSLKGLSALFIEHP